MAKAQYHKNQRVYVRPVGTWALVEKVIPHWTKGLDEPLRIHYDVGLGREFAAMHVALERSGSRWSGRLDSPKVAGDVVWDPEGKGRLAARLARLALTEDKRTQPAEPAPTIT